MGIQDFMNKRKTIAELQEENEELKVQSENEDLSLSIDQKRALRQKLRANGLNEGMFGSLSAAWNWFKKN